MQQSNPESDQGHLQISCMWSPLAHNPTLRNGSHRFSGKIQTDVCRRLLAEEAWGHTPTATVAVALMTGPPATLPKARSFQRSRMLHCANQERGGGLYIVHLSRGGKESPLKKSSVSSTGVGATGWRAHGYKLDFPRTSYFMDVMDETL